MNRGWDALVSGGGRHLDVGVAARDLADRTILPREVAHDEIYRARGRQLLRDAAHGGERELLRGAPLDLDALRLRHLEPALRQRRGHRLRRLAERVRVAVQLSRDLVSPWRSKWAWRG